MLNIEILGLYRGLPTQAYGLTSAINNKHAVEWLDIRPGGIAGDGQGDKHHHGGPERVLHWFSQESYQLLQQQGWLPARLPTAALGENLLSRGLTESNVYLGDQFALGKAVVEVCQPRAPCYRIDRRFGRQGLAAHCQQSGRSGWFCRVLQPGRLYLNDSPCLLERQTDISIHQLMLDFYDPQSGPAQWQQLLSLPALSSSWRRQLQQRLQQGKLESWLPRLQGPGHLPPL
ncbi:MOSC domain-containing protein [Balneatrix alpica]|uniref:MOSC domain-containing protein n=1 Tax=Balneatrix alpica TaxID=75684 RepID=A0ABV5ZEN9_9GAMM|nr:MOSC domain-containing protein [Balneatrix alpica]